MLHHRPITIGYLCPTVEPVQSDQGLQLNHTLILRSNIPPAPHDHVTTNNNQHFSSASFDFLSINFSSSCFVTGSKSNPITSHTNSSISVTLSPRVMTGPEGNDILYTIYYVQRGNDIFIFFLFIYFSIGYIQRRNDFFFFFFFNRI